MAFSNIGGIFICFVLIKKIKKYKQKLEEAPNYKPTMPSKYYRDIPNENTTPAGAAFLYYFKKSSLGLHIPDVISATILDLALKKYLSIEILDDKKDEVKIILASDKDKNSLSKDEKIVYEMLEKVNENKEFTMKEFERYGKKHSSSFTKQYNLIEPETKKEIINKGYYDEKLIHESSIFTGNGVGFVFLFIISFIFMIACIIPSIICAIYCFKIANRYNTLTQKGVDEKEAWIGLKNFMNDFSMMDKREIPELVLWEKYLVYATAFGISDKVLKDLKVVYPQIEDTEFMRSNGYTYLYLMNRGNFSNNFIHSINNSVTSSYNYSSGSGSGGGFSGGGGFGGGGGRNGRKINLSPKFFLLNHNLVHQLFYTLQIFLPKLSLPLECKLKNLYLVLPCSFFLHSICYQMFLFLLILLILFQLDFFDFRLLFAVASSLFYYIYFF